MKFIKSALMVWWLVFFFSSFAYADITIGKYKYIKIKRINLFKYEHTYRARLTNDTEDKIFASATLIKPIGFSHINDGYLDFGEVDAGETVISDDTFTITGPWFLPFYYSKLKWEINSALDHLDADGDGIEDADDLCEETASSDTVNRFGCSANDYLSNANNDYIDDEGFRYFTLNPLNKNPIVIKTLFKNVRVIETGFYLTGTAYVQNESGDEIAIRNCDIKLEYGEEGLDKGLTRISGEANHPWPDKNLLKNLPLTYQIFVNYLNTSRTSKAETGMDFGNNINDKFSIEPPLDPDISYLFFEYFFPFGINGAGVFVSMIIDPADPAFLYKFELLEAGGFSSGTFSFGMSLKGQIPYIFHASPDVGNPDNEDSFFNSFGEGFVLPANAFDWQGIGFGGFNGAEDHLGFGAHLFHDAKQGFSAYAGEIFLDGALFTNFDPDNDGFFPFDLSRDVLIGMSGKIDVSLNLEIIDRPIAFNVDSSAIISVKDLESAVYFHGDLEQEFNLPLEDILPVNLNSDVHIIASGLIDSGEPSKDFLRLMGEFALDFESTALSGLGISNEIFAFLKSFGSVNGELRVSEEGIWLYGQLQGDGTSPVFMFDVGTTVALFIDTKFIGTPGNRSCLYLQGDFGINVNVSGNYLVSLQQAYMKISN